MTKLEVWNIYITKNPKFVEKDSRIIFTERGIQQFFERTWDLAYKAGQESPAPKSMPHAKDKNDFGDIFGGLFGARNK
jgi:hypothetical protein